MSLQILVGDCREVLKGMAEGSVQCVVTSPPYWNQRNYFGGEKEIGKETSPELYVAKLVEVFREVHRVLKDDGVLFLNLGDSYCSTDPGTLGDPLRQSGILLGVRDEAAAVRRKVRPQTPSGLKPKDLIGIPWRVAFALQAEGWYLRSEITWLKRAPMPESVHDRPTSATEKIFLLSKSPKYYYNADAVRQPPSEAFATDRRWKTGSTERNEKLGYAEAGAQNPKRVHRMFDKKARGHERHRGSDPFLDDTSRDHQMVNGGNMRNYWLLSPENFSGEHFATFPSEIPRRCILAGCPVGGTVLDPFLGSGVTAMVALELGRSAIGIELNPSYVELSKQRCNVTPGLALD